MSMSVRLCGPRETHRTTTGIPPACVTFRNYRIETFYFTNLLRPPKMISTNPWFQVDMPLVLTATSVRNSAPVSPLCFLRDRRDPKTLKYLARLQQVDLSLRPPRPTVPPRPTTAVLNPAMSQLRNQHPPHLNYWPN